MAALIGILALLFLAMPVLSIIAIVKVLSAQNTLREHEKRLNALSQVLAKQAPEESEKTEPAIETPAAASPPEKEPAQNKPLVPPPLPVQTETKPPRQPTRPAPAQRPKKNLEEALGGKVAGLIGVMILVAGIAFLVGSPGIAWPTPVFKILMGLLFGGILLGAGHLANRTASGKFVQLARTMTGGGGGLFYFCIFAAYSLYDLCGPFVTALGLTVSAALLLFLSLVYNSQIVATLGILGAFITPLLVGGDVDRGIFPLAYIALINLPVMFLGIKKNWQVLYNSAYAFTLFYFYFWLFSFNPSGWVIPLTATVIYFAEFMILSLLILRKRTDEYRTQTNVARLIASTLFLVFNLYFIFHDYSIDHRLGIAFGCVGAIFAGLSLLAWKWQPRYKHETLSFMLCGITAIALTILESTNDSLCGLLWCVQAAAIAWFFRKPAPGKIQTASILLCSLGGLTVLFHLMNSHLAVPLWFHSETLYLIGGAVLIGITCWILRHSTTHSGIRGGGRFLQIGSFALLFLAALTEIARFESTDWMPWLIATLVFAGGTLFIRKRQPGFIEETLHASLSALLCLAVTLHMQLDGLWISLAWTLLGMCTALFALKAQSKEIQNSAILIGFSALLHATLQPIQTGANLILVNPHTLCGLFTAAGIGFQAKLYNRIEQAGAPRHRERFLWIVCIGAMIFVAIRNLFTALSPNDPLPWLLSSLVILFTGNLVNWMLGHDATLRRIGRTLVALVPIKLLVLDTLVPWSKSGISPSLTSLILWAQLGMLVEILWFVRRIKIQSSAVKGYYVLAPILTLIGLVSLAIGTSGIDWSWAIVSLWWGVSGITLTLFGFVRKSKLHRHTALLLFAATIGKVLLIDCSVFEAGARVMIFIGIGLLLLILSFIYQKVSAKIL